MRISASVLALAGALVSSAAVAQDVVNYPSADEFEDIHRMPEPLDRTIIVTGIPQNRILLPVSFATFDANALERLQTASVADSLATIPGVTVSRNGPVGGFTGVRIRGADAAQTLVVIDGVRVNDPTSPSGGFDFGNLLAGNIARIDVLRGSNSVVWGSDAIGGVVLVDTGGRSGISGEYGSHDTRTVNGNYSADAGSFSVNLGGGWFATDGISAARGGTEADGFRQYRGNARLIARITGAITASASIIHADSHLDLDGFAPPTFAFGDTLDVQESAETYGAAKIEQEIADFTHRVTFALADINRDTLNAAGAVTFAARGRTERLGWQGEWSRDRDIQLVAGVEREWSRSATGSSFSSDRGRTAITGIYGTATAQPVEGVTLGLGGRYDDHRDFGSDTSLSANALVDVTEGLSLRGSYSEGYKAPTLFQLSPTPSGFGNPALRPEESNAYDIGFVFRRSERMVGNAPVGIRVEGSLFRRDSRNLIDFVSCTGPSAPPICAGGARPFGTYANVDRARAEGAELDVTLWPTPGLSVRGGYAYIATRDRSVGQPTNGNRLARRPASTAIAAVDYAPDAGRYSLGAEVRLVGDSFDDAANRNRLDGYALVTLRGSVTISDQFELFGRVENLFDADYQTVAGYGTYGRTASVGIRARL